MNLKQIAVGTLSAGGLFLFLNACNTPTPSVTACPAVIQTQDKTDTLPYAYVPANCTVKLGGTPKTVTIKSVAFVHYFSTVSTNWPGGAVEKRDTDYTVSFTAPGTYTYVCYQHAEMTGTITVEN